MVLVLFIAERDTLFQVINSEDARCPVAFCFGELLSSSKKVSLRVICPEYLGPATWLSKHNSAPQGVLRATGQTGTEGTFAATCNNQLFPTPGKGAHCPG